MMQKYVISKLKNDFYFILIIRFVDMEAEPRLQ